MTVSTLGANSTDTHQTVSDCYINGSAPNANNNGTTIVLSQGVAGDRNVLLRFDLPQLPSGDTVSATDLTTTLTGVAAGGGDHTAQARMSLQPWDETQATNNNYSSGNAWGTSGSLLIGTDIDSTLAYDGIVYNDTNPADKVFPFASAGLTNVEDQIDGTANNEGFWLSDTNGAGRRTFPSSTGADGDRPSLMVTHAGGAAALVVQNLSQAQTIGSPTITQNHILPVDDLSQDQTISQPVLTQAHVLPVNNLTQDQLLSIPTLLQNHILSVDDLSQAQTIGNVTLVGGVLALIVQNLSQDQTIGQPALTQQHLLSVDDLTQAQLIDNVFLGGLVVGFLKGELSVISGYNGEIQVINALTGKVTVINPLKIT